MPGQVERQLVVCGASLLRFLTKRSRFAFLQGGSSNDWSGYRQSNRVGAVSVKPGG